MKKYNTYEELWSDFNNQESFQTEKAILEFTVELHKLMKLRNISKADLAKKIGSSPAYVTKVFRGNANFTIGSMIKLVNALDGKLSIHVTRKEENIRAWFRSIGEVSKDMQSWDAKPSEVIITRDTNANPSSEKIPVWDSSQLLEMSA